MSNHEETFIYVVVWDNVMFNVSILYLFSFFNSRFFVDFALASFLIFVILKTFTIRLRSEKTNKKRILFFDFLKGVSIIAVIGIHTSDLFYATSIKTFFSFAVPAFIVSSGFLLAKRYSNHIDLKKYYKNIFFRIVVLYLVFVILSPVMSCGFYVFKELILGKSLTWVMILKPFYCGVAKNLPISKVFLDVVLGRTAGGAYYFIPLLLQLYVLFPFLMKIKNKLKHFYYFESILLFSFYFLVLNGYLQNPEWNSNYYSLIFFGRFLLCFCFGMFLSEFDIEKIKIKNIFVVLVAYILILISSSILQNNMTLTYFYPFVFVLILLGVYNSQLMGTKILKKIKIINDLGKNSLIIYLLHLFIVYDFINAIWPETLLDRNSVVSYLLVVFITVSLSYIASKIIMNIYSSILSYFKVSY
jgi:fucose 4-O-acetylase-like acetyltransferase